MNAIFEKTKEVSRTLLPVFILVMVICFTLVDVETNVIVRFIIGSFLLLVGLTIFLRGLDLSMNPIGEHMSREVATSRSPIKVAVLSFLLGFLITVAEPDLLILGSQVESASGGALSAPVIVYMVSIGVGILVALGIFWLLKSRPLNQFMAMTYFVFFLMAFFVSEEFLAISFDASGATTGALTTPFTLALSLGLSTFKGGKKVEENAFGLVGVMSAGPMLALMLMSIITGQRNIQGEAAEYIVSPGILKPILDITPSIFLESILALVPISALFFAFNIFKFKLAKDEIIKIITGLLISLVGLTIFLVSVNSGFMDMGRILGQEIAKLSPLLLIGIGGLLGLIVVLVEPAVHVLGEQINEVTGGHIPISIIRLTMSLGVGIAIDHSMVRIIVPSVQLWYFPLPGFALAVLFSFRAEPVFVGIAYDAGGVASGPMTATFVLAFAQGAATSIESANVLVDGFGVIAMVAMAPVFSLTLLGTLYQRKGATIPDSGKEAPALAPFIDETDKQHECLMVFVNRGLAEQVVKVARQAGAKGATIIHGRGMEEGPKDPRSFIHMELPPAKEIILLVTAADVTAPVADMLLEDQFLVTDGEISVFVSPAEALVESLVAEEDLPESKN